MAKQYTYQGTTFGSPLAKEHWILQMNIRSLQFLYDNNHISGTGAKHNLKAIIKSMTAQEKRIHKQLIKDGYFKTQ